MIVDSSSAARQGTTSASPASALSAGSVLRAASLIAQIFAADRERATGPFGVKAICAAQVCIILQGVRLFGNTLDRSLNKLGNVFDKLQCTRWTNACTSTAARAEVVVDSKQPIIVACDRFVRANLKARHAARVTMTHAHTGRLVDFDRLLS